MGTSTSRSVLRRTTEDQPPPIDLVVSEPEDSQDSSSLVFHSHLQPAQLEKQSQQQLRQPEHENIIPVKSQPTLLSSPIGDDKSDVSYGYCTEAEACSAALISHGDVLKCQTFGPTTSYQEKTDFIHEMDRFLDLELPLSPSPIVITDRFDVIELNKLICSDSVPVILCQATLSGFASKGRSQIFTSLFETAINVCSHDLIEEMTLKIKSQGLSCFHFDILGSFPFDDPMWLCGTKRSSTTLSLMSSILRLYITRKVKIEDVAFDDCVSNEINSDDFAHKHIRWLYKEVLRNLRELKTQPGKMSYLQSGVCILNIFNVGYSKAAYEFLPFLTQHCNNLLPLVFLNIDHDLYCLQHPLKLEDMEHDNIPMNHLVRSRIKHLCHYALAGHQKSRQCPVIVGLTERQSDNFSTETQDLQKLQKDMNIEDVTSPLLFSPDLKDIIRKQLEEETIKEVKFFDSIPLRWIFLRSAIQVQDPLPILMKKSDIINLVASVVVMDNNDIEMFLKTFTSFGSLFYASDIPSLKEIVITDIERFVTCLDKVYNYQDDTSSDHGLIEEDTITSISGLINKDLKLFVSVVTSFQLAVPIMKGKVHGEEEADDSKQKYYIPSMRRSSVIDGPLKDSLYICLEPKYIPGNLQVSLTRSFLKYSNCFLVPSKPINITVIEVRYINGKERKSVQVTLVDHGDATELRLDGCHELYAETCKLSIGVCRAALENIKETLPSLQYHFAFCCQKEKEKFHYLENSHNTDSLCVECQPINQCWLSAYIECSQQSEPQNTLLTPEEMTKLAIGLSKEVLDSQKLEKLCTALNVPVERIQTITGWRRFLKLIMIWEENNATNCSKQNLLAILHHLGYNDM